MHGPCETYVGLGRSLLPRPRQAEHGDQDVICGRSEDPIDPEINPVLVNGWAQADQAGRYSDLVTEKSLCLWVTS